VLNQTALFALNRAIYLPAISETFATAIERGTLSSSRPLKSADLNFLDPNNGLFFYPFALYSAGQAAPPRRGTARPSIVTERDRSSTTIVGDSGGYQIQTGKIEFDPGKTADRMLEWLEDTADWSMILDFPTGGINSGAVRVHAERLQAEGYDLRSLSGSNGLSVDFNACLTQTKINNDRFVARRRAGATRLLNVLQGRNERESRYWYDGVKHYPFEGWAFAGAHKDHFSLVLRRLLDMHRDGSLSQCKWIHVLGVGSLQIGCLLTAVQRAVRGALGSDVQFSFDSATAFRSAAVKSFFIGHTLDEQGWSVQYEQFSEFSDGADDRLLAEVGPLAQLPYHRICTLRRYVCRPTSLLAEVLLDRLQRRQGRRHYPAHTIVAQKVTLGDLKDAQGKLSNDGYNLLMHHNVEGLLKAHSHAQQVFFAADGRPNATEAPLRAKVISEMIRLLFADLRNGASMADLYERIDEWAPRGLDRLAS
jgi:hypothetical protein